jgi:hypothetical protein
VKRRAPARAVVAKLRDPADLPHSADKPPAPVADTSSAPFVLEIAGDPFLGGGDALVDTGELLWLEDSPTVASTTAGSANDSALLPALATRLARLIGQTARSSTKISAAASGSMSLALMNVTTVRSVRPSTASTRLGRIVS